ncbi:hypothetical protein Dimus_038265 [Dionaea muscipula]
MKKKKKINQRKNSRHTINTHGVLLISLVSLVNGQRLPHDREVIVWDIAMKKDRLWIRWIHEFYLNVNSIWSVGRLRRGSWAWNSLLKVRDQFRSVVDFASEPCKWTASPTGQFSVQAAYCFNQGDWQQCPLVEIGLEHRSPSTERFYFLVSDVG